MALTQSKNDESALTLRDIISVFFYTKHIFFITLISVVLGAVVIAVTAKPIYQVSGRLVVKPRIEKPLLFESAGASRFAPAGEVDAETLNTVVHLMTATDVLKEVVLLSGLATEDNSGAVMGYINMLRGMVKAEPLPVSNIVQVTMKAPTPHDARDRLNILLDSYIAYHIRVNQVEQGRLEFFTEQAKLYRKKYKELNRELAEAKRLLNLSSPNIQLDNELGVVRDLQGALSQIEGRHKEHSDTINAMSKILSNVNQGEFIGLPTRLTGQYPALVEMEKSLAQLVINLQAAENDFLADSKPVRDAKNQYLNMRDKISEYIRVLIDGLILERDATLERANMLRKQLADSQSAVGRYSDDVLLIQAIELERDLAKDNYTLYEMKREESRINEQKDRALFANVSIAARPNLPSSPSFPNRSMMIIVSIPLGIILALIACILTYSLDQSIRNPTDIRSRTKLKLLGTLDAV